MDVLYKTQSELQSGKTKLETMISDLKREKVKKRLELILL